MSLKHFLTKHVYNVVRTTTTKKVLLLQTSPLRRRNGASIFLWHYERNYWVQNCANYWHHVLDVSAVKGPTMWRRLERKISFLDGFFLFIYSFFFCYPHFSFFFFLIFLLSAFFFPSAFFYPHFPIRIRHPQVSGPRFKDTHQILSPQTTSHFCSLCIWTIQSRDLFRQML